LGFLERLGDAGQRERTIARQRRRLHHLDLGDAIAVRQRGVVRLLVLDVTERESAAGEHRDHDQHGRARMLRGLRQLEAEIVVRYLRNRLVAHASSLSVDRGGLRRKRLYITGTKNSVVTVARPSPPITARPNGAFCSPPSPNPVAIGNMPKIIASA